MASIARYKDSKYLIAIFRDAQGRQHRRTTRETTRKRALAVAQQFERAAKGGGSASRVRSTFAEFFREHYLEDLQQQSSVRSYVEQFLDSRKNETSARSREVYRLSLEKFLELLGARADRALDELTRQQISSFRDAQLVTKVSAISSKSETQIIGGIDHRSFANPLDVLCGGVAKGRRR